MKEVTLVYRGVKYTKKVQGIEYGHTFRTCNNFLAMERSNSSNLDWFCNQLV